MAARSLNKVMLLGNLTRDPEVKYTATGAAVASFAVATNKSWKNQEGNVEESTEYHNIVAWGKMAEICEQLLAKGAKVYVEGELRTRSWEGEDKVTKYRTEIRISEMILISGGKGKPSGEAVPAEAKAAAGDDFPVADEPADDDLPF